jgi:hypothetical protein
MSKAGRLGPEGSGAPDSAAFSAQQHVQVVESAKDNLSCLFFPARGCPALFGEAGEERSAQWGGKVGAGNACWLRRPCSSILPPPASPIR